MEEEEEGQPSLEQTATSVAAGEEEEGELGEGTGPTDQPSTSASTSQTNEEGGEREKCGVIEPVGGVYTCTTSVPLTPLLSLLPPLFLSTTSNSACEEKATTNCLG